MRGQNQLRAGGMGRAFGLDFTGLACIGVLDDYPMREITIMLPYVEAGIREAGEGLGEEGSDG